jgi:hypothetical protein
MGWGGKGRAGETCEAMRPIEKVYARPSLKIELVERVDLFKE